MRIMLDTNVLISAFVFRSMKELIKKISDNHIIVLCSYVIDEMHSVVERKFPNKAVDLEEFLERLSFELIYTPKMIAKQDLFTIRDINDEKVLYSAIMADADILITGDKDFFDLDIEKPEILTPSEFLEKY